MLKAASISLDHMNVPGDARALMCDSSEPERGLFPIQPTEPARRERRGNDLLLVGNKVALQGARCRERFEVPRQQKWLRACRRASDQRGTALHLEAQL